MTSIGKSAAQKLAATAIEMFGPLQEAELWSIHVWYSNGWRVCGIGVASLKVGCCGYDIGSLGDLEIRAADGHIFYQ